MSRRKSNGLAIISVLFLSVLILGFIGAAITSTPVALRSAQGFSDQQQAGMACEAGIAYAQTRLREDPRWRGSLQSGPIRTTSAADNSITVYEDHGNVVGLLVAKDGTKAQFRIRFNYEDGPGGADGSDDPTRTFSLAELEYISQNNLSILSAQPRQTTSGTPLPDAVPREVLLVVEGRAGPGLRDHGPSNVNAVPNRLRVVSERLEVSMRPSYDNALDAVLMAAGNISAKLPNSAPNGDEEMRVRSDDRLVVARLRTKQGFDVEGGTAINYRSPGVIQTASGAVGPNTNTNPETSLGTEGSGRFLELDWDDIKKADPSDPTTIRLNAGTYLLDENLRMNYYDLGYSDFEIAHANGTLPAPVLLSDDFREVVQNSSGLAPGSVRFWTPSVVQNRVKAVLEFNADVSVAPTANTDGLALVTSQGPVRAQQDDTGSLFPGVLDPNARTSTSNLGIWLHGNDDESITLSSPGDILMGGVMYGEKGGITTEGNLTTAGTTFLDSSNSQTISGTVSTNLYAKGDIEISTYRTISRPVDGEIGKYGHFLSSGVTYSWGDITIRTQEDGVSVAGGFRQRGAMVAYGGDPSHQAPGDQAGTGNISIQARRASFIYDSSYVGLIEPNIPPDSFRIVSLARR